MGRQGRLTESKIEVSLGITHAIKSEALYSLQRHRHPLAATDAKGGQALVGRQPLHPVQQGHQDPGDPMAPPLTLTLVWSHPND